MREYKFRFLGSVGMPPLEFTDREMSDAHAARRVERTLPLCWPGYYRAVAWYEEDGKDVLVGEWKSSLVVTNVAMKS